MSRLLRQVSRLEGVAAVAAAAAAEAAGRGKISVCWSRRESRVDDGALLDGDCVACDVYIEREDRSGEVVLWDIAIVERVTRSAADLGLVYRAGGGAAVGYVVRLSGDRVDWELGGVAAPAFDPTAGPPAS